MVLSGVDHVCHGLSILIEPNALRRSSFLKGSVHTLLPSLSLALQEPRGNDKVEDETRIRFTIIYR